MWDYIKYIMYLEGIDVSDHNAIEHYVHQQVYTVHLLINCLYCCNSVAIVLSIYAHMIFNN